MTSPLGMDARFGAWLAVSALLIVTPGPDTALVIRNALRSGAWAATLTGIGVAIGSLVWAGGSALGIAVLLQRSLGAFTLLKFAGAIYLGYLGVRSLLTSFAAGSHRETRPSRDSGREPVPVPDW